MQEQVNQQEGAEDDAADKKKKKMTPAMLKKLQSKLAEEAKHQIIRQRQEYLRETKARVQAEWEANHAKMEVYEVEFMWRLSQLQNSYNILAKVDKYWEEYMTQLRTDAEWIRYVSGGRLPNPASGPEMNTYVYVWTEVENNSDMGYCITKTEEVMKLLDGLEALINHPAPDCTPKMLEDLKESRCKMRNLLQGNIDKATFYLFSRIESDMVPINVTTSKYTARCPYFLMSLWAELITPIPSTRGKEVRQPLKVVFEEAEVVVIVPVSLLDVHKVMRCMWLYYDHWSDRSQTYECAKVPAFYSQSNEVDLLQLFLDQNNLRQEILSERDKLEVLKKKKIGVLPLEPTLSQEITAWDSQPQRSLSEEVSYKEWEEEEEMARKTKSLLREGEVNLREWTILGDLLLVEVLHQPPQPKRLRYKHSVTLRQEASVLKNVDFYYKLPPPEPEEPEQLEEVDRRRLRRMNMSKSDVMSKYVQVQLKPCQSVMWFEEPKVAYWNSQLDCWSTEDICDVEIDDDEGLQTITFKSGRLGLFGLYVNRYCNLPYEDWLFEPDENDEIKFYLKTPKLELYFKIRVLKKKGLDVFPPPDATAYLENTESKHYVIEKVIYQVWGLFSKSFRFKRSKFNQSAGRFNIVFQAQEIYVGHQVDYCLIQNSMCSSYVLDITEDSLFYSPDAASTRLCAVEPYGLLYNNCTLEARRLTETTSYLLIATVKEFLGLVRPLSFS
ncbi:hypothetical protein RUM44_009286 [Polyplax serrata]|uniref:Axonemal 84 kDa protein n=1 Tax=Polyplax serrata TaxID=468196 RepID=A0ABR1AS91_POLSC